MSIKTERDKAEIQLIALMSAIKGFCKIKPKMTVVELNKMMPKILKFAREALEDDEH